VIESEPRDVDARVERRLDLVADLGKSAVLATGVNAL